MYKFNVSVVVATYNPDREKLFFTLKTILYQKNLAYEIIITDDGSKCNYFEDIEKFFEKLNFKNYILINNKINIGTVENIKKAINKCDGKYIKLISPGDSLINNNILMDWYNFCTIHKCDWSFSNVVYYCINKNGIKISIIEYQHPNDVSIYDNREKKIKYSYLILNDICLGAATLVENQVMKKYINLISGIVKYAEDNMYRLMVFDGLNVAYYDKETIYYEYGLGISTSGNSTWNNLLKSDWNATNDLMLNKCDENDKFQKCFKKYIQCKDNKFKKIMFFILNEKLLFLKLKLSLCKRKSKIVKIAEIGG